uniref:Uncharacterized protein n=1 Tax=Hyaloperonospora arabidopsidis (strain Emoy2) TaxID=559515 RepID=M4BY45_HYAAE
MDVASKLRTYAILAVQDLWGQCPQMATIRKMLQDKRYCPWYRLQQNLGQREALVSKPNVRPPLPQPVERRVHLTSTTEGLEDIKTHLQLLHAALDNLQQKGERINENFGRLQRLVQDIPTCRCEAPRDRCTSCTRLPKAGPLLGHSCNIGAKRRGDRLGGCPTGTSMLQVDRLDVPMDVVKRPTAVQAFGAALLDQLVKAVDEGEYRTGSLLVRATIAFASDACTNRSSRHAGSREASAVGSARWLGH